MDRRTFIGQAGCGVAAFLAGTGLAPAQEKSPGQPAAGQEPKAQPAAAPPTRKRYRLEIEIFEARTDSWCHKKGDTFKYPEDMNKICPWFLASMHDFLILLQQGVTLGWKYEGTPYEKVIDPNGVTTEFVRCPDPTSSMVAKITRTLVT
jgi:uncharacterized repeat protein (TIGR04076 family)